MGWLQVLMLLYGAFDIVMGLIGTLASKNHEPWSLVGGGLAGLLVIGCAFLTKTNPRVGFISATVIGLLVAFRFAPKAFEGVVYPAGIIFAASVAFAVTLVAAHFVAVNRKKGASA